jgi:hypothetical protein
MQRYLQIPRLTNCDGCPQTAPSRVVVLHRDCYCDDGRAIAALDNARPRFLYIHRCLSNGRRSGLASRVPATNVAQLARSVMGRSLRARPAWVQKDHAHTRPLQKSVEFNQVSGVHVQDASKTRATGQA